MDSSLKRILSKLSDVLLAGWSILGLIFLIGPVLVVIPMSFSSSRQLKFPPEGFSLQWYRNLIEDPLWREALRTSFLVAIMASVLALVIGALGAYVLVRGGIPGASALRSAFAGPLVIPPVVLAVALYLIYAQVGMLGSIPGIVIAHATLALPFVVLIMSNAVASLDVKIEQAARSLGASRAYTIRKVIAPAVLPHLVVSWLFAFIVSFDEVVITIFVSGTHVTMPKKMFLSLRDEIDPTITAVSTGLIALTLLVGLVAALVMRRRLPSVVGVSEESDQQL